MHLYNGRIVDKERKQKGKTKIGKYLRRIYRKSSRIHLEYISSREADRPTTPMSTSAREHEALESLRVRAHSRSASRFDSVRYGGARSRRDGSASAPQRAAKEPQRQGRLPVTGPPSFRFRSHLPSIERSSPSIAFSPSYLIRTDAYEVVSSVQVFLTE